MKYLSVFLLAFAVSVVPDNASSAERFALVIGNSGYQDSPLANPVRDAALMAKTLRDVGFEVLEYNNVDRRDLTRAFLTFGERLEQAGSNATALVYYAGHGAQVDGENYLIPVGARIVDEVDVEIEGVRASSLLRTLRNAKSALNIVILDACRNNPFENSNRSATRGLAKMDAPTGTLLAYSTAPGKVAEDGSGKNSTYTKALARAIKTPGAKVEEVFKTVRISVVDRTQGRQVPWESSSLTGDFIFQEKLPEPESVVTASTSSIDDREIEVEYWKSISASTNPALFEAYIDQYPEGLFRSIAEQRVASLNVAQVAPSQDVGFAREKAIWDSVKDSGNIGMLNGFLESYPDGSYATIARATIADLESRQQVAAITTQPVDEELVVWESVKNAETTGELQVYLDTYPEGKFAKVAKAKIAALNSVGNITKNSEYPFDGRWRLTGIANTFKRFVGGICQNPDSINSRIDVTNGEIQTKILSKSGNSAELSGTINRDGQLALIVRSRYSGWDRSGKTTVKLRDGDGTTTFTVVLRDADASSCNYDFKLRRLN